MGMEEKVHELSKSFEHQESNQRGNSVSLPKIYLWTSLAFKQSLKLILCNEQLKRNKVQFPMKLLEHKRAQSRIASLQWKLAREMSIKEANIEAHDFKMNLKYDTFKKKQRKFKKMLEKCQMLTRSKI